MMKKVTAIIPVYNEGVNVEETIFRIEAIARNIQEKLEVLFVDDGSTDDTWRRIENLHSDIISVRGIRLSRNFGKDSALFCGIKEVEADAAIFIDGDLQHPPEVIFEMLDIWRSTGCDIVEAKKRNRGVETVRNRLSAFFFYKMFKLLCGQDIDNASDFKLIDYKVIRTLAKINESNLFFRALVEWVGFNKRQIQFDVDERVGDVSKWSFIKLLRYSLDNIASFTSIPLQLSALIAILFTVFSLFLGCQTLFNKYSGVAVSGFTTVIILLLIVGSSILFCLSVVGFYLGKIYREVKRRPQYIVMEETR